MRKPQKKVSGIGFGTALVLFIVLLFAIPVAMVADLVHKALTAEMDGLNAGFFAEMEGSSTVKRQFILQKMQEPFIRITKVASDPAFLTGGRKYFEEKARPLLDEIKNAQAVALVASDGTVIDFVGSGSLDTFRSLARASKAGPAESSVLQSMDGFGVRISGGEQAPFFCVKMDLMALNVAVTSEWKTKIEADRENCMAFVRWGSASAAWQVKVIGGGPPGLASMVASLDFNGGGSLKLPAYDPRNLAGLTRKSFVASGGMVLGLLIEHSAGEMLQMMVKDARSINQEHELFRKIIIIKIFLAMIGMLILSYIFAMLVGTPIRRLGEACEGIEAGAFPSSLPLSPFREINLLGRSLLRMASTVESQIDSANRELMEQNKRLRALFQNIPDAIYLVDKRLRVVMANPVGKRRLELEHIPAEGLVFEGPRASLLQKLIESPQGIIEELRLEATRAVYKVTGSLLVDLYGECFGYLLLERDITLEKEVDRMKTEFVSNVSHELRTPLTSIQAYTEMLLDGEADSDGQRREYLEIISQETERLTRLVNDVLDLSRMESGRQLVRFASIDPVRIARHSCQVMERWAQKKNHQLSFDTEFPEAKITADKDLFEQVLLNLLSNAIKYTPANGRISLTCKRADGEFRFEVRDTGIGMNESEKARLFTKFFRADNEVARTAGGTGLGLVLVLEIARLHKGRVSVESSPGNGSCFSFCLPIAGI